MKNFRGLHDLEIASFGRVNLVTGKNNAGKSSLLEALHLYANLGSSEVIRWILTTRDEYWSRPSGSDSTRSEESLLPYNLKYLIYGRPGFDEEMPAVEIGQAQDDRRKLTLQVQWLELVEEEDEDEDGEIGVSRHFVTVKPSQLALKPHASLYVSTFVGRLLSRAPLERFFRLVSRPPVLASKLRSQYVAAHGLDAQEVGQLWDAITLTDLEPEVLAALRLLAPDIERISFVADAGDPRRGRHALVKFGESEDPVPIRSLGEGVNRLFGLTLALVNARDGILLIDEVESGLHYSVQRNLWEYMFRLATNLNVQIFAITHSYDCIRAFQQAAIENPEFGTVIRLDKKDKEVSATLFEEPELEIAADHEIEVR